MNKCPRRRLLDIHSGGHIRLLICAIAQTNVAVTVIIARMIISRVMNFRNLWIASIVGACAFFIWQYFDSSINTMRTKFAISPDAVIMFHSSNCGQVCLDKAALIKERGIEVVNLDVNDGTAGTHLWQAVGGSGPFPVFLMGDGQKLQNADGDLRSKLIVIYGKKALKTTEKRYFAEHFNVDDSPRAVLYTNGSNSDCQQLKQTLEKSQTLYTEIDVNKQFQPRDLTEAMEIHGFPTAYIGYEKIEGSVQEIAAQIRDQ